MTGATTGQATGEVGLRVAPRVVLFGSVGRLRDAQSSALQASVNDAIAAMAATDLTATGTAAHACVVLARRRTYRPLESRPDHALRVWRPRIRASRADREIPLRQRNTLTGTDAVMGDDITSDVVAGGLFTTPAAKTGLMLRTGGGIQIPLGKYLLGNVNYSVSHISAATPFHTQDLTFGVGIRF